jgi:transcriptional regulator with XRE-family HTH domain
MQPETSRHDPLARRLRALREDRLRLFPTLFTQDAVAHRIGVSTRQLQRWEAGDHAPHRRHAAALARELGVTVEDLTRT